MANKVNEDLESSKVWVAFMVIFMIVGVLWLITTYLSDGALFKLGNWNILIGFGFIIVGFFMTTKWK